MKYSHLNFGRYFRKPVNEVPIDYLIWIFAKIILPKTRLLSKEFSLPVQNGYFFNAFGTILEYFLSLNLKVKFIDNVYKFFISDHIIIKPDGNELECMISKWKGINSKGENVYEFIYKENTQYEFTYFVVEQNGKFFISTDYVKQIYTIGKTCMVYEKTEEYYFIDSYGKLYFKAFLLKEPYIPENIIGSFSENIKINEC